MQTFGGWEGGLQTTGILGPCSGAVDRLQFVTVCENHLRVL